MAKIKVYNLQGEVVGEEELDKEIFSATASPILIHQAVVTQQNNSRVAIAHTKTKGEIRGGGIKPWKQKGTGRARAGSSRSPLWRGGGIIFGPRNVRNFQCKINAQAKNKALRVVLSEKANNAKIILLEKLEIPEIKTKKLQEILNKLPSKNSKVLLSLASREEKIIKAAKNIKKLWLAAADSLNIIDLLKADYLVLDKQALAKAVATFRPKKLKSKA